MATEIDRLVVTLDARLAAYEANMRRAQTRTNQQLNAIEGRFSQFSRRVETAGGSMGLALGTLGTYLGAQQLTEYANGWTRITRSLDADQQVFGVTLKNASELTALANEARVDLDSYTKLYVRTSAAIRDYGFSAETAAVVTSTLSKALKLGGATAGEQASVLLQFSQALQKGKLDGDEFRTVMENAGIVQELLAKRLGVTKGQIVTMAAAGKLQIKDLVGAMTEGADLVDRVFRGLPVTVDEAFQVLNNNITEYVGNMDEAYGISQGYAGAVAFLARNIETTGDVAIVLGGALLAAFAPAVLARIWAFAAAMGAAQGPLGLVTVAIAAAGAAYVAFGDDIQPIPGQLANLQDVTAALADVTHERLAPAFSVAGAAATALSELIVGTSNDIAGATAQTEGAIASLARKFAEINAFVLNKTGVFGLVADVNKYSNQRNIGAGFAASTAVTRPKPAAKGAGSSTDPNAKLSAYQKEINEVIKRTNALEAQAKVVGATAYETQRAAAARDLLTAAEETARRTGTAVTAAQVADIQQLADKYGQIAAKVEYLNALQSAKENIETLQQQNDLVGLQGAALEEATVRQQLLTAARKAGVEANIEEINAIAQKTAAEKQFASVVSETRDIMRDSLKNVISDLREGKSGLEAFGGVLDKIGSKLLDMAVNGIVENALGGMFSGGASAGAGGWLTTLTKGFSAGGYTGNGGRNQPAGVVHKGEFVVNAAATAKSRPLLEALNAGGSGLRQAASPAPAANGGVSSIVVAPVFHMGNATPETVDKAKTDLVPLIKGVVADEMRRNKNFGRT